MFYLQHDIDIFSHSEKKKITGISKLITRLHKKVMDVCISFNNSRDKHAQNDECSLSN